MNPTTAPLPDRALVPENKKEFTVINETTGREEPDGRAVLQEILGGMSETMYNNTISISQLKSATDEGMVSELKTILPT